MKELSGFIFDTSTRTFRPGRIRYSEIISNVAFDISDEVPDLFIIPGLIDNHMHIESSMTNPLEFSRISLAHGTTTIISDCHETANVFSVKGLEDFMQIETLNDTFYALPSSVPASSPKLETTLGIFDEKEVRKLAKNRKIIALGEIMNAEDLFSDSDNRTKRIIKAFKEERPECPIEGHCPRLTGESLDAFIATGISSDHTEQTPESIREKSSKGMFLQIQYKSLNAENVRALSNPRLAPFFSLATDDVMPDTMISEGHLDRLIRKAIELGMKPGSAVYASTYTPAVHMRLFDRGIIAPGKIADFVVLSDLINFKIEEVIKYGKIVTSVPFHPVRVPDYSLFSIKRDKVTADDFNLGDEKGTFLTILHKEHSTMTECGKAFLDLKKPLPKGFAIIASVERYGNNNPVKPAIIENSFTSDAAIASSWAHDNHNILVMGTNPELLSEAVNVVIEMGGGIACTDGRKQIRIPLKFGGIASLEPLENLAKGISDVRAFMREHGWKADEEIMSFAVLSLPVSPKLKVTDKGLIDTKKKEIVDWKTFY